MAEIEEYHVLALSGGGFRGLYTATILAELENELGIPLARKFDLICGTSIGGILALGLAAEIPAARLQEIFEERGKHIFRSGGRPRRWFKGLWKAKHDGSGLRAVLESEFGDKKIGDLPHRVLIPTVNCSTGKGQFYKTPHSENFERDHIELIVDVAMATSAAPVYFPMSKNGAHYYADGALVGNAPGAFGLHEVQTFFPNGRKAKIRVLAIGTMSQAVTFNGDKAVDFGILRWREKLIGLMISVQESSVDFMLKHSLGEGYLHVNSALEDCDRKALKGLDDISPRASEILKKYGKERAKDLIASTEIRQFLDHTASTPVFYHGPNKTI